MIVLVRRSLLVRHTSRRVRALGANERSGDLQNRARPRRPKDV